jgi:antitoxin (DNA-binding transcriptional repressor) of toxin-antitoxin stability system
MMIKTSSTELKTNLGKFLDFIQSGEDILVSRNGKYIAIMKPVNENMIKKDVLLRIRERAEKYSLDVRNPEEILKKELKKKYD